MTLTDPAMIEIEQVKQGLLKMPPEERERLLP